MRGSEYVIGRLMDGEEPIGPAHAVLVEAAQGDGPYRAECGEPMDAIRGGPWPPSGPGVAGPCPVCARLSGA